jgi:hypothetical protein
MLQRKKISGSLSGLRLKKRATQRPSCQSLPSLRDSNAIDAARNLWRRPHGLPQAVRCPRSRPIYEKRRRLRGRASLYSITGSDRSGDGRQQSTTTVRLSEELRLARNETQRFTWPPVPADVKTRGVVIPQAVFAEEPRALRLLEQRYCRMPGVVVGTQVPWLAYEPVAWAVRPELQGGHPVAGYRPASREMAGRLRQRARSLDRGVGRSATGSPG